MKLRNASSLPTSFEDEGGDRRAAALGGRRLASEAASFRAAERSEGGVSLLQREATRRFCLSPRPSPPSPSSRAKLLFADF